MNNTDLLARIEALEKAVKELQDQEYNYTIKGKQMKFVNGYFVDKDGNEFHGDKL